MNKSYLLLNILFFTSLTSFYNLTILGMERKHEQQILKIYAHKDKLATEKYHLSTTIPSLSNEMMKDHVKPYLSTIDKRNLRLTCKEYAIKKSGWYFMPDNVEKAYDLLSVAHKNKSIRWKLFNSISLPNKFYQSELILAAVAEQNDCKAIKWIIDNIKPTRLGLFYWNKINPVLFAKKNKNIEMGELIIKTKMKINGYSNKKIIKNWKSYYDNPYDSKNLQSFLYLDKQRSFFPSYFLAAQFDNVDRLKELCSKTQPTTQGISLLLDECKDNAPDCFIYLFEKHEDNDELIEKWDRAYSKIRCEKIRKNFLYKK